MKEYWTVRAKVDGQGPWRISDDGFLRMDNENWGQFKKRSDAYTAMAATTRVYENLGSGAKVTFKLVHHTVKTKPRGAKVGTWAWACEQMATGSVVWKCAHQTRYYIDGYGNMLEFSPTSPKPAIVTKQMIRATSWGRVP